ncbi:MAG TPA: hypothetical protein VJX74_18180, partial [Blastocatellia bacterium]|nr:hypothetical protein [Blastocatellia bacterium]
MDDIVSHIDLPMTVFIDFAVLATCVVLLLRYGRLSHSHPGTIYIFFHVYTFTFRLLGLLFGAATVFSSLPWFFEAVRVEEIIRAAVYGDIALLSMTVAWIRASVVDKRNVLKSPHLNKEAPPNLSLRHIWTVVLAVLPFGIFGFYVYSILPGLEGERIQLGEWQTSSWLFITQTWIGLVLLVLIYWYGFRWWLTVPMSLFLLVMGYQGYHRFRVIIPAILLTQIYLDRKKMRWPPVYVMGAVLALGLVFFPMKEIGKMAQQGETVAQIIDNSKESISSALVAEAPDQTFLDLFACALTLVDENGKFYHGSTYLNLIILPVPRQWWPDKPTLGDYVNDISRPWRPMFEMGMIVTFLGESYANFGFLGIILVPYLVAYWLARIYFRAYRSNYFSVARFVYLLIACNLIQVY